LLDAVEDEGRLTETAWNRWQAAKFRLNHGGTFEGEAAALAALLAEIRAQGRLAGTWIEQRCCALDAKLARN
jgi:hypothetical protein